jgi:hypothetical protein
MRDARSEQRGAGLLYPGFLHHDSQCVAHVKNMDGEVVQLAARTLWCRFVSKSVHAVGVRWTDPVDVRQFVSSRDWLEQMAGSDEFKSSELEGSMLTVGIDELEIDLLKSYLTETKIVISTVPDSGAALDRMSHEGFDFVMVDADNPVSGLEKVRGHSADAGGNQPLLVVTSRPDGAPAFESESDTGVLTRPYSGEMLIGALRDLTLAQHNPLTGTRPIACELPVEKHGPVRVYLQRLRDGKGQIEEMISADRADEAIRFVQILKNTASGFGFPLLEQAAEQAVTALNASGSAAESSGPLRAMCRVIDRLRLGDECVS